MLKRPDLRCSSASARVNTSVSNASLRRTEARRDAVPPRRWSSAATDKKRCVRRGDLALSGRFLTGERHGGGLQGSRFTAWTVDGVYYEAKPDAHFLLGAGPGCWVSIYREVGSYRLRSYGRGAKPFGWSS